jgi:hypothetical protein
MIFNQNSYFFNIIFFKLKILFEIKNIKNQYYENYKGIDS